MKATLNPEDNGPWRQELLKEVKSIHHDYKASVVAAEVAENGLSPEVLFFRNQSTFKRSVSNDIEHIFWSEIEHFPTHLVFDLNREGIYDMLPEALTHTQAGAKRSENSSQKNSQILRKQEKDARTFFSPLENEFAHRALKLDIIERELLKNNNPDRNREFFSYFFGDSTILTDRQLLILLYILPLSHKIRGDLALISLAMSRILPYEVEVTRQWSFKKMELSHNISNRLNMVTLGTDSVLGDCCHVYSVHYKININGISAKDYADFQAKGKHRNVLGFMLPYFFAAGADLKIVLHCAAAEKDLATQDAGTTCFLGFNSYI